MDDWGGVALNLCIMKTTNVFLAAIFCLILVSVICLSRQISQETADLKAPTYWDYEEFTLQPLNLENGERYSVTFLRDDKTSSTPLITISAADVLNAIGWDLASTDGSKYIVKWPHRAGQSRVYFVVSTVKADK